MSIKIVDFNLKKKYANLALKWCKDNFGINYRKRRKVILEISNKPRKIKNYMIFGNYCFWRNKITIYEPNCKTDIQIVSTVIHEYTHYLQSRTKYQKYEKTHYYSTHPLERSAFRNEEKYAKMCLKEIKKLIV